MARIVIIGNGVAGITAARNIRKRSEHSITVISGESDHFYSRPALMYIFMGHMEYAHTKPYEDWFWKKNRIDVIRDHALLVDTKAKTISLASGDVCHYDSVVFATGAKTNFYSWPGQDLEGVQGFTNLNDLELLEQNVRGVRRAIVVGGGLIGIEVAEMLRSRDIATTMLVRETSYWNNVLPAEESAMVNAHLAEHHVDVRYSTQLAEIVANDSSDTDIVSSDTSHTEIVVGNGQRACAVVTNSGERIECQLVVLTAGVRPRIDLAQSSGIATQRGILVDEYFATSVPDVFAIGDCAERPNGRVDLLWYTARAHGETLAATLCGERTAYRPGVFFNSAKFFDIEYQTYGVVPSAIEVMHEVTKVVTPTDSNGMQSLTWSRPDKRRFLRIVHSNNRVVSFNAMGVRLRAEVCTKWINEAASLDYVVKHIALAQFDAEFTERLRVA